MRSEAALQIGFLTGQSDPAGCALSPVQQRFLHRLAGPGRRLLASNYPYHAAPGAHRAVPLWLASVHNGRQYLAARAGRADPQARAQLLALLARAPMTVLLAGSCGLQLLDALALPAAARSRVAVFAYGPVAKRMPPVALGFCVRGRHDGLSRLLFRGTVDAVPACGHLDYLADPQVLRLCRDFVAEVERVARGEGPCAST